MKVKLLKLTLIMSMLMLLMIPVSANAEKYGDLTYKINNYNTITITDCSSSATSVTIPDEINGIPVTSIGRSAFSDCTSLTSIEIPDSVTSIGDYAFYGCSKLTSVIIGDGVTSIGDSAFSNTGYYNDSSNWEDYVLYIGNYLIASKSSINGYYVIKDGTKCIGDEAFSNCDSLTSIEIPDSVTSIGDDAFSYCDSLISIKIPDSVTSIGDDAFYNAGYYKDSSNWEDYVLYIGNYLIASKTSISGYYVIKDGTKCIGYEAFSNCSSMTSVEIPDSVTSIGDGAFYWCSSLTSIEIPDSVTSIGGYAFRGCDSLTSVTIGDSVTSIGYEAFSYCDSLISIEIPDSVTSIGKGAFSYCDCLISINVEKSNPNYSSVNGVLFNKDKTLLIQYAIGKKDTEYIISDSVTSVGDRAFSNCDSLTSVTIPDCVTSIGYGAFSDCSSLISIEIPDSVTSVGDRAFSYCDSLTSVTISDGVTNVGDYAFYKCDSLTSVTIGDSVTSIGDYAFYDCSSLESVYITDIESYLNIDYGGYSSYPMYYADKLYLNGKRVVNLTIPNTVTQIPDYAFHGCDSLKSITIPDSVTSIGGYAFRGCDSLTSVTIGDSVTSIGDSAFLGCISLTSIEIPDSVTSIGYGAFSDCTSLTSIYITDIESWCNIDFWGDRSNPMCCAENLYINGELITDIVIPDGIESIKSYAFSNCDSLKSITIPDSVASIGGYAFRGCDSLTSVTIGDSVTSIENYAFYSCNSLTSVTIGDGVTSIGRSAFYNCSKLKTVVIPKSITEIEAGVFANCNAITTVEYKGSEAEWAEMYIGGNNGTLTTATVNYGYVLTLTVTYEANGGDTNIPEAQKAEKNSEITISAITPTRDGYTFLGWATTSDAKNAEYQPNGTLTVGDKDITLYAVWKRMVLLDVDILNKVFIVTPTNAPKGCDIIFTCYKDDMPVYVDIFTYEGNVFVPFVTDIEFDKVKVMIWDSLNSMMPLCDAQEVVTSEPISLLMIE